MIMKKFFAKLGVVVMAAIVINAIYIPLSLNQAYAFTEAECKQFTGKTCTEFNKMTAEEQAKLLKETCTQKGNCQELQQVIAEIETIGTKQELPVEKSGDSPDAATTETEPEPFVPNNDSLKDLKFDVGKVLSLDPEDQDKAYFNKANKNPPIIELILSVIEFATKVIGSVAIIILIIGGFMFMFSQGNEQNLSNAKDVIKYAIIGLIATFASYIAVLFVQSLFFDAGV